MESRLSPENVGTADESIMPPQVVAVTESKPSGDGAGAHSGVDIASVYAQLRELEAPLQQLAEEVMSELTAERSLEQSLTMQQTPKNPGPSDGESESEEYCVVNSISGDLYYISDRQVEAVDADEVAWVDEGAQTKAGHGLRISLDSLYRRTSCVLESISTSVASSASGMSAKMPNLSEMQQQMQAQMPEWNFQLSDWELRMPDIKMPELNMAPLRLRPSWNTSFGTAIRLLRYASANLPRNVHALRFVSDNGIPKWTPMLPAGVSCEEARYPPGEWYYPTARGLTIRQNAQPESMTTGRFILYFHGGAFALCSTATHRGLLYRLARDCQAAIFSVNYRRPPEFPYPTPVDDCLSAYLYILEKVGDSSRIVFAGDSAGGNLVLSTMLRISELGLDMPAGGILLSPWVDLDDDGQSESWTVNKEFDYIDFESAAMFANMYKAGSGDSNAGLQLRHSSLSPLHSAHLDRLPPLLCEFGDCEVLRDQILAFCEKVAGLGGRISYHNRADMVHVFPIYSFTDMPQCVEAFRNMVCFVNELLGEPELPPEAQAQVAAETKATAETKTTAETKARQDPSSSSSSAEGGQIAPAADEGAAR
jgi:epsilon-lactone hydrolase